jgi:hypothetical protein
MTRKGKIARLPRSVRDELNRRLDDGEQGIRLVEWLNGLAEVQAMLTADFGGRPINEQNLSDWKDGGCSGQDFAAALLRGEYRSACRFARDKDWRRSQQAFELASGIMEDAQDRGELTKGCRLSDRVGEMAALSLARMIGATMDQDNGAEQQMAALNVIREVVRLRQSDRAHERALREQDLHVRRSR